MNWAKFHPNPHVGNPAGILHRSIKEFYDRNGPVGAWITQQRHPRFSFHASEMEFCHACKPALLKLAPVEHMSVDKLRSVAEGLLEIAQ
jgi:hypothetical protein